MQNTERAHAGTLAAAVVAAIAVLGSVARAQAPAQPLFAESAPLAVTIEGPFRQLGRERQDEPELPGTLRYVEADGREVVLEIQVEPRGISRLRHCAYPPLWLNFRKSTVGDTVFAGQDKLKLVTHCMQSSSYEDFIAREYQIYRMYNALTDRSFRVRWLTIEYVDTDDRRDPYTAPGFLIEEDWAVAERLGREAIEVESLEIAELDRAETALVSVFHFMIGNADWSALRGPSGEPCCHNGKVLTQAGQTGDRIVVPYDFDQATFVDAEYAVHNESLGLRGNQRLYRGFCALNDELDEAIAKVNEVRDQWLRIVDAEPVSERGRRRGVSFIESGYEILADPQRIERDIRGDCRGGTE